jgi:hypothetical protein
LSELPKKFLKFDFEPLPKVLQRVDFSQHICQLSVAPFPCQHYVTISQKTDPTAIPAVAPPQPDALIFSTLLPNPFSRRRSKL